MLAGCAEIRITRTADGWTYYSSKDVDVELVYDPETGIQSFTVVTSASAPIKAQGDIVGTAVESAVEAGVRGALGAAPGP